MIPGNFPNYSSQPYCLSGLATAPQTLTAKQQELQQQHLQDLRIPRRPKWGPSTSALELDHSEREAFLDWRRKLAKCVGPIPFPMPHTDSTESKRMSNFC